MGKKELPTQINPNHLSPGDILDFSHQTYTLANRGDEYSLRQLCGNIQGEPITMYYVKQTGYAGDGMSTSPATRTATALINDGRLTDDKLKRNLLEFYQLFQQFQKLPQYVRAYIIDPKNAEQSWRLADYMTKHSNTKDKFKHISDSYRLERLWQLIDAERQKPENTTGCYISFPELWNNISFDVTYF